MQTMLNRLRPHARSVATPASNSCPHLTDFATLFNEPNRKPHSLIAYQSPKIIPEIHAAAIRRHCFTSMASAQQSSFEC